MAPTGVFTRSRSGGVVTVKGSGAPSYPPATVRDLIIDDIVDGQSFNLSFTSPGATLNTGTLSKYIIFFAANRTDLDNLTPTSAVSNITEGMLDCNCTLSPVSALTKVKLRVASNNFERNTEFNFRILAVNNAGKTSESNIVVYAPNNIIIIEVHFDK